MGFWEQMNGKHAGGRNLRNKSCISDIETEYNEDDSCESTLIYCEFGAFASGNCHPL